MKKIRVIAFDADDTLWVNETIFTTARDRCLELLAPYVDPTILDQKLYETEIRNLKLFGCGIKGFTLSMIETAIELSQGKITGSEIERIIDLGKDMLMHPVHLLAHVEETLKVLQPQYELMIITKGDLFDQESKIARSGLANYFTRVEIVSEKDDQTYKNLLSRTNIQPAEFLMVGNSMKSDILPICRIGGKAVYIPFHVTWGHEKVELQQDHGFNYTELSDISLLPKFLEQYNS